MGLWMVYLFLMRFFIDVMNMATYMVKQKIKLTGLLSIPYLPFDKDNAPTIYFIQTESDGKHLFNSSIQNFKLTNNEHEICIKNGIAPTRSFTIEIYIILN